MQLTSPPPALIGPTPAPGPIGVSSIGTLRVGHAVNGIAYTEHKLFTPLDESFAEYTGSLQDAIVATTAAIKELEARGDGRIAVALLGMPGRWVARTVLADPTVMRVVDQGVGHGGIASAEFTSLSRSFGALVTSKGTLLSHVPR